MSERIKLYGYWRSSAAYRVRIGLNLKQLSYESKSVHLVRNGGEQHAPQYRDLNASELVPVLVDGDVQLNQSLTILQYLDENYLIGQVPLGLCNPPFPDWRADIWTGNHLFTDCMSEVQCDCCDRCYDESGTPFCWNGSGFSACFT